ncbi:DNA polymerase Y family protein [Reinekea forsetii]|nr:DNA polymerase Y family protein [Reinekea forsetii]
MLWLHIHFPQLALEAQFLADPRALPQLLLAPALQTIVQCNDMAREQGVQVGMNKKTAFCLLTDCAMANYDAAIEADALNKLALLCYRHAAQITLVPPDGLLLEVGSMLSIFNGIEAYWQHLQQRLQQSHFRFQMSMGHTPKAAQLLAQAGIACYTENTETFVQALHQLSVEQLGLPHKTVQKLLAMGIREYGKLKQMPRKELGYRFGLDLVEHLYQLERSNQPSTQFQLPASFLQTIHLTYEAEHAKGLLFPLRRCLEQLETYLRNRQLLCEKILIKLTHRDGRASVLAVPSVRGSYLQADWLLLLQTQLDHTQLVAPVVSVSLRAKDFLPFKDAPKDLLGNRPGQADADLMQSILIARLGTENVHTLAVEADPRPEVSTYVIDSRQQQHSLFPKQWPTFLLPQAKPIRIDRYHIISGPERIEGGWWDAAPTRRDYYVATLNHQTHWIYRRDDGQWFLQGVFA